jgi:hypothetical protein
MIHQSVVVTSREWSEQRARFVDGPDVAAPTFVNGGFVSRSSSHS